MNMKVLDDELLESVNGGFKETNKDLPTAGMNIVCPDCHSSKGLSFNQNALYDPELGTVEYTCKCGCPIVCQGGIVYKKDRFLAMCAQKGINYPFK